MCKQHRTFHKIAKLSIHRCCDEVPDLSRKLLVYSPPNRLPTIIVYCSINPPLYVAMETFLDNYVVAYSFICTMVSAHFYQSYI